MSHKDKIHFGLRFRVYFERRETTLYFATNTIRNHEVVKEIDPSGWSDPRSQDPRPKDLAPSDPYLE